MKNIEDLKKKSLETLKIEFSKFDIPEQEKILKDLKKDLNPSILQVFKSLEGILIVNLEAERDIKKLSDIVAIYSKNKEEGTKEFRLNYSEIKNSNWMKPQNTKYLNTTLLQKIEVLYNIMDTTA